MKVSENSKLPVDPSGEFNPEYTLSSKQSEGDELINNSGNAQPEYFDKQMLQVPDNKNLLKSKTLGGRHKKVTEDINAEHMMS
jgi:hypothetical protein